MLTYNALQLKVIHFIQSHNLPKRKDILSLVAGIHSGLIIALVKKGVIIQSEYKDRIPRGYMLIINEDNKMKLKYQLEYDNMIIKDCEERIEIVNIILQNWK